jgi:hypothetical protein
MMIRTAKEIQGDIISLLRDSALASSVSGAIYRKGYRPLNSQAEDIVVGFVTGITGDIAEGVVVVNVYVADIDAFGDGTLVENVGVETNHLELTEQGMSDFQEALKASGFNPGGTGDWSDNISNDGENPLHIPEPRLALVNISGIEHMPTQKGSDWPCVFEMWDMQGNYFKKCPNCKRLYNWLLVSRF